MDIASSAAGIHLFLARTQLVEEWERRVRADDAIPSARRLETFRLRAYVPRFIDLATDALRGKGYTGELRARGIELARVNVVQRIDEAFSLDEVLLELGHLRAVLLEHLGDARNARSVRSTVGAALDDARGIVEAAYGASRTRIRGRILTSESGEEAAGAKSRR